MAVLKFNSEEKLHAYAVLARVNHSFRKQRIGGDRVNPEPAEKVFVCLTALIAMLAFAVIFWQQQHYRIGR